MSAVIMEPQSMNIAGCRSTLEQETNVVFSDEVPKFTMALQLALCCNPDSLITTAKDL